jgi:carbonic anhydrase
MRLGAQRGALPAYTAAKSKHSDIMSTQLQELLDSNRLWAAKTEQRSPGFFTGLLSQQAPQYLWIGCADSRVPANELVDLLPGELFVHRNVANVVVHSDLNALSVIQFATDLLQVKHIIVVGHSRCGGVVAALNDRRIGLADNWIRHVQDVRNRHQPWLDSLPPEQQVDALGELNVIEQARNVCQTTIVQGAWARGQELVVHGWFYGLHNGLLRDLKITVAGAAEMAGAFEAAIESLQSRHALKTDSVMGSLNGPELPRVFTSAVPPSP